VKVIDGKKIALEIRAELKEKISKLGTAPGLAVLLIGNNEASRIYVGLKEKASEEAGIKFEKFLFSESASEPEILKKIDELNNRADINGTLVQLPLPAQLDEDKIIAAIAPQKDVDGFHPKNLELIKDGHPFIVPGVALGIMKLIESTGTDLKNKKAILLVNSEIFAIPLKYLLLKQGASVDMKLEAKSPDATVGIPTQSRRDYKLKAYDIIIIALGQPKILKESMVKDNAVIIDVGTTKVDGHLSGDADFESFRNRNVWITPVPGGVGPMTVAMLLQNVYFLAKNG